MNKFETKHFLVGANGNLILIDDKSIKYLGFNGELLREMKIGKELKMNSWCLSLENELCCFNPDTKVISIQRKVIV